MRTGNDLWWSQVRNIQEARQPMSFKEAELEAFKQLYTRMKDDGMLQEDIRNHFHDAFNIRYTAFYTRLRKVRMYDVV